MGIDHFWAGFEKRGEEQGHSDAAKAVAAGGGAWAGMAGYQGAKGAIRDEIAYRKAPHVSKIEHLKRHVKPGDILFTRKQKSPAFEGAPLSEKHVIQAAMGSPEYHAALYTDKKDAVYHAYEGSRTPLAHHALKPGQAVMKDEAVHIYRPTKASKREVTEALKQPGRMRNRTYKDREELMGKAFKAVVMPHAGEKACHKVKGRISCNEVITSAYPKQFKRRGATIEDMKSTKGMKLVATYGPRAGMRENFMARVVHPVLRNARWAPVAAAGTYGALKLRKALRKRETEKNPPQ